MPKIEPPPAPEPPPPPEQLPTPAAELRERLAKPPTDKPARKTSPTLALAWAASIAIVLAGGIGVFTFRAPLIEKWPPLARIFPTAQAHGTTSSGH